MDLKTPQPLCPKFPGLPPEYPDGVLQAGIVAQMGIAAGAGSIGHTIVVSDAGVVGVSGVAGLAIRVSPPTSGDVGHL